MSVKRNVTVPDGSTTSVPFPSAASPVGRAPRRLVLLVLEGLVACPDPLLQLHELGTGLQTDVVEGHARPLICAHRVSLATTPVQGDDE